MLEAETAKTNQALQDFATLKQQHTALQATHAALQSQLEVSAQAKVAEYEGRIDKLVKEHAMHKAVLVSQWQAKVAKLERDLASRAGADASMTTAAVVPVVSFGQAKVRVVEATVHEEAEEDTAMQVDEPESKRPKPSEQPSVPIQAPEAQFVDTEMADASGADQEEEDEDLEVYPEEEVGMEMTEQHEDEAGEVIEEEAEERIDESLPVLEPIIEDVLEEATIVEEISKAEHEQPQEQQSVDKFEEVSAAVTPPQSPLKANPPQPVQLPAQASVPPSGLASPTIRVKPVIIPITAPEPPSAASMIKKTTLIPITAPTPKLAITPATPTAAVAPLPGKRVLDLSQTGKRPVILPVARPTMGAVVDLPSAASQVTGRGGGGGRGKHNRKKRGGAGQQAPQE